MIKLKGYNGILFVGDPHLWSSKPSKRLDIDFTSVILDKISQAVKIALRKNLYLIFLGDLFHVKDERNIEMLTKLVKILTPLREKEACATVEGNHEKSQTKISDDVALGLLEASGIIKVMGNNGWWGEMIFDDKKVLIGSTPYGSEIPREVKYPASVKEKDDVFAMWLTHHSLAFEDTYPGAVPVHEIKGVQMLVNGHIHDTKKPMKVGNMMAHNPGNITRLSVDTADHVPAVWVWTPEQGNELEPIPLIYQKGIFKINEEIKVEVKPTEVASEELSPIEKLRFMEGMEAQIAEINHDEEKSADGSEIKIHINAMSKALGTSSELNDLILGLVDEALQADKDS